MGPAVFSSGGATFWSKNVYFSIYKSKCISATESRQKQRPKMRGTDQVSRRFHYKCNINRHSLINWPLWRVILAVGTGFSGVAVVKR